MSLRERILLVLMFILCCYTAMEYSVLKFVITPELKKQEHEQAKETLKRCTDALESELTDVYKQTTSLGESGVLAPCAEGTALSSVNLNTNSDVFDFIIVYNHKWEFQTGSGIGPTLLKEIQQNIFDPKDGLINKKIPGFSSKGLTYQSGHLFFISSAPVTKPKTPHRLEGTVITGHLLNAEHLQELERQLRLDMHWDILNPAQLSTQAKTVIGATTAQQPYYFEELGEQYLQASTVLYDRSRQPVLLVKLNRDRAIALQGLHTMFMIVYGKLVIGIVSIIFLTLLLQQVIINPISKLIKHIVEMGHPTSSQKTLASSRKDEFGTLANEFNQMCRRLQNAQVKLVEKSYLSGVTEMSSGILHNVRNAISPITTRIERLKSQFDDIPLDNLQKAQSELQIEDLDANRRNDLARFVDLTFESVINNLTEVVEGLDDLFEQVIQIEDMLNIQRTFGRADKPVQFIEPSELISKALEMIPEEQRQKNRITIDAKIKKLNAIPVEPSTFLQVLQNLLVNCSESLDREKPLYRKIDVSAKVETDDSRDMLHWKITDNGAGIPPEKIHQIFERGASSKRKGLTGIGLHWCANTITAMRGRIWAESSGEHTGATFHILMPVSAEENTADLVAKESHG